MALPSRRSLRTPARVFTLAILVLGTFLLWVPTSSSAAGTLAGFGSGAGRVWTPTGVAVDQATGMVYVADEENDRVDEFEAGGGFVRAFGFGVVDGAEELQVCTTETGCSRGLTGEEPGEMRPDGVAVDGAGDVYVADFGHYRVEKFSVTGDFLSMFGKEVNKTKVEEFNEPGNPHKVVEPEENLCTKADVEAHDVCGFGSSGGAPGELENGTPPIAVDSSGDVWVGDVNRLEEFGPEGKFEKEVKLEPSGGLLQAGTVTSLAVDASGDFYVRSGKFGNGEIENNVPGVREYGASGVEIQAPLDESGDPRALALDPGTGDLFISDQIEQSAAARLLEYDSAGTQLEAFGGGEVIGHPKGNAVAYGEKAAELYVASCANGVESAVQVFSVPPPGPLVEPSGSTKAGDIGKTGATLNTSLDPEDKATTYHFEYLDDADFKDEGGFAGHDVVDTAEVSLTLAGDGFEAQSLSAEIPAGALTPGTLYHFQLVANGVAVGEAATFETLPSAQVLSTSVTEVTSTSAVLDAKINPLGDATTYHFEYISEQSYLANHESFEGTSPATKVPSVEIGIGSGTSPVEVSPQPIEGLEPHTVYRYRLVAVNEHEHVPYTAAGPAQTFMTHAGGGFALVDAREWEMVSPPQKDGGLIEAINEGGPIQAAANGDAMTYYADQPVEEAVPGVMNEAQVLSTRGAAGWSSRNIELPHESVTGKPVGEGQQYRFFSEDLSKAVVQQGGAFDPELSPEASEQTAFLRSDFFNGNPQELCTPGPTTYCYRPLVTGKEGYANVPAGTEFGEILEAGSNGVGPCPYDGVFCGPRFAGASPDGTHVVLSSSFQLTPTTTPAPGGGHEELYEWAAGKLALVSLLPEHAGPALDNVQLGFGTSIVGSEDTRHAVSDSGMRVFWSIEEGHLYMRDLAHGQTVLDGGKEVVPGETLELDKVQGGEGRVEPDPKFQGASGDGSRVFFTDRQQLAVDSSPAGEDLYECTIVEEAGKDKCVLTDLTPETAAGESAGVQHSVIGASENGCDVGSLDEGCYVYFVANGVLSGAGSGAVKGDCNQSATVPDARCNLYVWHDGVTSLVAVLSGEDDPDWAKGETAVTDLTARVSPDGRWLAFMSDRGLTGYDTADAVSGAADEEVYVYEAEHGRLVCASCDPAGGRPEGVQADTGGVNTILLVGGNRVWGVSAAASSLAGNVPGWTPFKSAESDYDSRYLSDSGRLFFNAFGGLVPRDVNGQWDVYEWEPEGVPSGEHACSSASTSGSEVFEPAHAATVEGRNVQSGAGCVGLISSGSSAEESAFLDASESGGDVFFLTTAKLESQDYDHAYDIYDAHECTSASPCIPPPELSPPPCETAEACRGAQSPQPAIFGASPSETFNGQGNLAPVVKPAAVKKVVKKAARCKKGYAKNRKGRCVRRAKSKKAKKSHRGAK